MLRATHGLNMVVISVKLFLNPTSNNEVMGRTQMGRTDGRTDGRTRRRLYASPKFFGEHNKSRSEPGNAPRIGIGHREVVCQKKL